MWHDLWLGIVEDFAAAQRLAIRRIYPEAWTVAAEERRRVAYAERRQNPTLRKGLLRQQRECMRRLRALRAPVKKCATCGAEMPRKWGYQNPSCGACLDAAGLTPDVIVRHRKERHHQQKLAWQRKARAAKKGTMP